MEEYAGLDFADAALVFAGRTVTVHDAHRGYGEGRFITAGHLAGRCGAGLDTSRRGASHHIHEVCPWRRRGTLVRLIEPIPTTLRN
jgi:uncharacterized DUF497 family protein